MWIDLFAFRAQCCRLASMPDLWREICKQQKMQYRETFPEQTQHLLRSTRLGMRERERFQSCCGKLSRVSALFRSGSNLQTPPLVFLATHEIIRRGKPFTDGEYVKELSIKISEHLFSDFKKQK